MNLQPSPLKRKENDLNQTSREVYGTQPWNLFWGVYFSREIHLNQPLIFRKTCFLVFRGVQWHLGERFPFLFHCLLVRVGGKQRHPVQNDTFMKCLLEIFRNRKAILIRTTCTTFLGSSFWGVSITWCGRKFIYRYQIFVCWFASSNDKQHCPRRSNISILAAPNRRMRGVSQASNVKQHLWSTLLGTNTSPTSQHFWVDDFPNFPRWGYVSEPWMVFFPPNSLLRMESSMRFFWPNSSPLFLALPMEWNLKTRQDLEDITYPSLPNTFSVTILSYVSWQGCWGWLPAQQVFGFQRPLGGFWFKRSHTRWDLERGHDVFLNIYLPTVSLLNKILTKMSPKYGDSI